MNPSNPDALFDRIHSAIQMQSWREAWGLLEQANPDYYHDDRHLGARRHDFLLSAATCLRHRGQLEDSERVYLMLQKELGLQDPRLADVLIGRAEVAHAAGNHGDALQMLRAAKYIPGQDRILRLRGATINAHVHSHINIQLSLQMFQQALGEFRGLEGTAMANFLFWYGDALLVDGQYAESMQTMEQSFELSTRSGAAVTLADAMRRLPLVRVLSGDVEESLQSLKELQGAEELYHTAGDRGTVYLHTERGEVLRSMSRWRDAENEFNKGLWASRDIGDVNRQAHNKIGLFEVGRQTGRPKSELLDEAWRLYGRCDSDWGRIHVLISRALGDYGGRENHLQEALALIDRSQFSDFKKEQEIIRWMRSSNQAQIEQYPHLMNYP